MIFGRTYAVKKARKKKADANWFAWHPVHLEDGRWAWLQRLTRERWYGYMESGYSYELKGADDES